MSGLNAPAWLTARPIAHRGLHDRAAGRAENTIAAAEAAIAGGFAIECDVQLSSDGEAMVFHDFELERLTGQRGLVRGRRASDLALLSVGGTVDYIPTLAGFLDRIAGRVPLVVEIKSRFDGDELLARRTAEILAGRDAPVVVKSFDPAVVALMRALAPTIPRGIVGQSHHEAGEARQLDAPRRRAMTDLLHWPETRPDFISWRHTDLPCAATALPRAIGNVPVMTWTVRGAEDATRVRPYADQIVFEGFRP